MSDQILLRYAPLLQFEVCFAARKCAIFETGHGLLEVSAAWPGLWHVKEKHLQDWEAAKLRQDKALDNIEKGLGVLSGLGEAMGENLNQQDVLLTEIDSKVRHSYEMDINFSAHSGTYCGHSCIADGLCNQKLEDQQHEAERACDPGQSSLHISC